ncbi:MAG: cation:dicarboxylase symporter family transporter [Cytophagales bacterium]|nr:cation:dicarboxylase symporter family transporter [Cytophagales bacterium]
MSIYKNIAFQVFIALFIGVMLGFYMPGFAQDCQILSDIFLRLIKMLIAPLVLSIIVVSVAKLGDLGTVGRIGAKTLLYFFTASVVSLLLGMVLVNVLQPGRVVQLNAPSGVDISSYETNAITAKNFIKHIIPASIFEALAANEILAIVLFGLLFGIGAAQVGKKAEKIVNVFDGISQIMFKVTNMVMYFAPVGVLGAVAATVGKQGMGVLQSYLYLLGSFYLGLIIFSVVILGAVCMVFNINYLKLFSNIKAPLLLAFSTASSESAMPQTIDGLNKFGCHKSITNFVIPLGYSFNLDGSMMYMTFASLFIAQSYNIQLSLNEQITMLMLLLVTSKGVAGVPRASLIVIAGMLATFHIPAEGLVLLLGIDQLLDMGRSGTNVLGNAVATCVVAKWEGKYEEV